MNGMTIEEDEDNPSAMTPKAFNSYLIKKIIDYWEEQGHRVRVWAQPISTPDPTALVWEIKSDLRNGLPGLNPDAKHASSRVLSPPLS